jgi:hypothetical protein
LTEYRLSGILFLVISQSQEKQMDHVEQQEGLADFLNGLVGRMPTNRDMRTLRKFLEDPELRQRIRRNISFLRVLRNNLSGQGLAEKAGIHPSQFSRLSKGRAGMSLVTLCDVAKALGVSLEKLVLLDLAQVLNKCIE